MHKESKNGAEDYPVYVHWRSGEVRRPWTGFSGEANSDSLLGELHRGVHSLLRGLDGVGRGSAGWSTVAGDRAAAGTPCMGQTPVVSGSGEVERVRRSTVEVPGGFIGMGAGNGAGSALERRGAHGGVHRGVLWRAQSASNTWLFASAPVLPSAERSKRMNLALRPVRDLFPAPRAT
jgi:hypothetical protein